MKSLVPFRKNLSQYVSYWHQKGFDIKMFIRAFLNETLEEDIYIKQLQGFEHGLDVQAPEDGLKQTTRC